MYKIMLKCTIKKKYNKTINKYTLQYIILIMTYKCLYSEHIYLHTKSYMYKNTSILMKQEHVHSFYFTMFKLS